jgi:hypothetical protein
VRPRHLSFLALLLAGCAATPLILPRTPSQLDATSVLGTWHVGASTFPMWLDGTRTSPTFTYSELVRRDGRVTMRDVVSYQRHGQLETLEGLDVQHARTPSHFSWSGRGFLAAFTSEWDVVFLDAQRGLAIITFSRTLATPAGLDVIWREPLSDEAWNEALAEIDHTPELKAMAAGLTRLP